MAEKTGISWADATLNFWIGCTEVSVEASGGGACDACYARELAARYGWAKWGAGEPRHRTAPSNWRKPYSWNKNPGRLIGSEWPARKPRVFINSLSDFCDNEPGPMEWRPEAWTVIGETQGLEYLIVTKRISNFEKMLPERWNKANYGHIVLIITVCNQAEANRDIPKLVALKKLYPWLRIGLSIEPMRGMIDLEPWLKWLDWVICGGETDQGKHIARPMHPSWPIFLMRQCVAAGVPYHYKQNGDWTWEVPGHHPGGPDVWVCTDGRTATEDEAIADGGSWSGMYHLGTKKTGRELDGMIFDQFPRQ